MALNWSWGLVWWKTNKKHLPQPQIKPTSQVFSRSASAFMETQLFAPLLPTGFNARRSESICYSTICLQNAWCVNKMDWKVLYPHQSKWNTSNIFLHAYRFQEEWTRDTAAPVCRKDQDHLPKLTTSRSAPLNQVVPGPRAAVQSVDTIHVVEVYRHTDSCNKPNCRIPG